MRSFIPIGLFGFVISGCSFGPDGENYNLYISPEFSQEQQIAIRQSVYLWEKNVAADGGKLSFNIQVKDAHCGDNGVVDMTAERSAICIAVSSSWINENKLDAGPHNLGRTFRQPLLDSATCHIAVDVIPSDLSGNYHGGGTNRDSFIGTVAHEIGHGLGLNHNPWDGNALMNAIHSGNNNTPTIADIDAYKYSRGEK